MKRLILLLCLTMFGVANADFLGVKQASETISFFIKEPIDSAYGIPRLPDSVHIFTYADNASAATFATRSTTYPFSDVSIDTLKRYGDTTYVFADQISDLDGGGGNFELAILVRMFTNGYYLETYNTVQVVSDSLENFLDASKDSSASAAVLSKNNLDSLQSQDDYVAKEATLAYFDTLIYVGPRGLGVYLDSAAANTNTVLGTDGTSKNPVSTIAAAKTIATALGYNRYYFLNTSTFNDAANDIPSDHQNWEFIGIGQGSELAFGTQRVDGSRFENMDLSGTMHASGGDVLYTNCTLGYITANFNGHAFNCLLADTIVVKADQDIEFVRCQSDVGGNRTPTIDLSGGSSVVQIRAYSGGIRVMNGASTDTMSIETIGQVIISANNTSTNITVRGILTLTDSGTTTNVTKDAVFSRAEADLWIWANADTTHPDSSEIGVWLVNNLSGAASGLDTLSTAFVDRLAGRMADTTWLSLLTARDGVAGSFGDSAQGWGATAASALDSTIISNILHRIVWGTPVGSGSDSSTSAQRDIGVISAGIISSGSFVAGAIDANAIASAAFTTAKFGTGFIQNASFADRAISLAKFDTAAVAAYYGWGIWLDGAAANTNTTVGVDGTRANPVSTLAAARTLADSMGLQAYYLTNSSSFTLAATYEDWEFIGIGEGSLIDFGSQDVDGSVFDHLMISGTQGGTGMAGLHYCYLNTIDSLEAIVINSSFSDTISVRVSGNTVFDQCYSNVAGNNTPGLDFNSAGTINVSVRHYSGGLALFNMTSTHTISYESDGQLVIDASCTGGYVTARGNMNITRNGTTTSLTDQAVFNVNAVAAYPSYIYKMVVTGSPTTQSIPVSYIVDNEGNSPGTEANDFCLGMELQPKGGNSNSKMVTIADFTIADSTFTVRPFFASAPNSGDTIFIRPGRGAVEPTIWTQHELLLTGAGRAAIDLDNTSGDFATGDFEDSVFTAIKFDTDYWAELADRADSGAAATVPDSLLEIINEIKAMATLAGVGDSMQVRYIDDDGSDADGLTPATAWTDFTEIQNLTVPTVVLVSEGTYTGVVCSVEVGGISIKGVDGPGITFVRGTTDTVGFATERVFNINPGAEAPFNGFKISGLNIAHRVPNTSDDPGFKNAIFFSDSVANVWIENCVFPDSNYKTIAGNVVTNFNVTGCIFYRNKIHSIDVAGYYGRISDNIFIATTDTASIGVYDAIQLTTGAKYMVISHNYGIDQQNFVSLVGADSNLVVGNYSSLSDGHYVSDANAADNVFADNYGENKSLQGLDAGGNQPNTVQEEERDFREQELMNPLPGSIIPNGHLQVAEDDPDSTDPAGWGTNAGTLYLTSRRAFESYERSLYFGDGSVNTLQMKLDTGYYEMAAQIYFANATTDTAFFQCYNSANEAQNWLSSGGNIEYAVGWTGWRRFARLIRLTGDSTFYFSVGANTGDSAYFAEVSLMPYGAVGHTLAGASITYAGIVDTMFHHKVFDDTTSGSNIDTTFADFLVSTGMSLGKDGFSPAYTNLHMKVGTYSGAAGDNNNIKDDIAAIAGAGGSGAYSCSIFVWDGASAITSGQVRMISGVNEYAPGIDANGWAVFSLDGGTWSAYATALRFIQDTIPQTITFSTHHVDTITMSAFSPSTPTDTGMVNLYVWTDRILGGTLEGATFRVIPLDKGKNWVTGGNRIILTGEVTVKTDSTGYAEVEVYQSSYTSPYPSGSDSLKYNISITYPGLSYWAQPRFVAPDTGNSYQIGVIE